MSSSSVRAIAARQPRPACAGVQGFGHDDSNACICVDAAGGRGMFAQKALREGELIMQVCAWPTSPRRSPSVAIHICRQSHVWFMAHMYACCILRIPVLRPDMCKQLR